MSIALIIVLASTQVETPAVLQKASILSPEERGNIRILEFQSVVSGNDLGCGVISIYTALLRGELANLGSKPIKGALEVVFKDVERGEVVAKKLLAFEVPAGASRYEVTAKVGFSMIIANRPGVPEVDASADLPADEPLARTGESNRIPLFKALLFSSGILKPMSETETPVEQVPTGEGPV